uniref:PH domain-containing protein n=1 Tax=Plectus sambesii TaxID=2011161 RepID=A0A914UM04_9BILA
MNSEQLQEWLTELNSLTKDEMTRLEDPEACAQFLHDNGESTEILMDYLARNYADQDLTEPIFGQVLSGYYRGGVLRQFALQLMPTLVATYLIAVSKGQRRAVSMLETMFMAVYNEEILAGPPGCESILKRQDIVRIPCLRVPSIYHDPGKISQSVLADSALLNRLSGPSGSGGIDLPVQLVVKIGPFPAVDRLNSETRFMVLARLLKSVNASLAQLNRVAVCHALCRAAIALCRSGFHFPESDLIYKVLGSAVFCPETPKDVFAIMDDFSSKPRIGLSPSFLLELLNGVYFALFNGAAEWALRAIDTIHQRSTFEMFPDVLLVTNAIVNSLLENPSGTPKEDEPMGIRIVPSSAGVPSPGTEVESKPRRAMITNASLRVRRMPEDIPVKAPEVAHSSDKKEGVEGMIKKKIAALRVDGLAKPSKSDQSEQRDRKKVRKERSGTGGSSGRHDTVPEVDESAVMIELDEFVGNQSDEATITDAMVDHLAASNCGGQSPPQVVTHSNGTANAHTKHDSIGSIKSLSGAFGPRKPVDELSVSSTPPDTARDVPDSLSARKQFFRHMDSSVENLSAAGDTNNT